MGGEAIPEELRVRVYPDKVLRRRADKVARDRFGDDLGRLASRMADIMYDSAGVGLAAPQVGVSLRLIVIDPDPERRSPTFLVNPRIVASSGRYSDVEGCLSVQHEVDHLDGRLFIDRLGPEGRLAVRDDVLKLEEAAAGGE